MAGVITVMDSKTGFWKSPAGLDAGLTSLPSSPCHPTNDQAECLNVNGVNITRSLPGYGTVVWGSRTLDNGFVDPGLQHISVSRTIDFVVKSLAQSLTWTVFHPNGPALWADVQAEVASFMYGLWWEGAVLGRGTADPHSVEVDSTTTTAKDIADGLMAGKVSFAVSGLARFETVTFQVATGR